MNNQIDQRPIRTFLAVRLPLDLAATLYKKTQHRVIGASRNMFDWVAPQQQHVTLKFLGDSSQQQLEALASWLEKRLPEVPSFDCMTGRFDFFPDNGNSRALALHMHSGQQSRKLAMLCEEGAIQAGFAREKRNFRPHVTLARLKDDQQMSYTDFFTLPSFIMDVSEVLLMQSHVDGEGSAYRVLHRFSLQPQAPVCTETCDQAVPAA